MELVYGTGDQTLNSNYASGQNANYNGNITMIKSRTQGQSVTPTYGFMYDGLNRLTAAYYGEKGTSTYSNLDRYTEYQSYDLNGNILSLDRYGLAGGSAGAIDDLTYTYTLNSNQISGITESVTNTTFRDKGFKYYSSGTYTYDAAGNVTNEPSKGAVIAYNYFNLPRLLTLGSNTIEIEYDGGGNKLRKTVKQGSTTLYIQNYLGGIEYNSGHLEAVFHAEGRVYNTNVGTGNTTPAFRYEYAIRDHLGNTRILFTDKNNNGVLNVTAGTDNEIIQENQYYPFGMNQEGAWMNDAAARDTKYQYNGKELNDDFGLGWSDYGARWYDAAIGRWNGVDPLAEKMQSWSPYHFAFDNPLRFMDSDGMAPDDIVYFNMNGEEIYRKESDTEFRTFVAKSSTADDNYLRTDANLHSASSGLLGGMAFDEATMPGVITQEMSGHKPEQSKYQYLDYQIAAATHIFNKELASGNLNFDQQSYEIGERATPLDVNLVKSLAYKESGLGLGASISTEAHDVLSMYNPGDNSGKNLIGMTAEEISTGGSSKSSLNYGIRWLHFKGYRSDDGVSKNFRGWDYAVYRFGPGDAKEPGYANKVKSIRNSMRPATAKDY